MSYHILPFQYGSWANFSQVSLDPGGSGGRQDWCPEGPGHETQGDFPISEPSGGRKASHEPGGKTSFLGGLKMVGTQKFQIPIVGGHGFSLFFLDGVSSILARTQSLNMLKG